MKQNPQKQQFSLMRWQPYHTKQRPILDLNFDIALCILGPPTLVQQCLTYFLWSQCTSVSQLISALKCAEGRWMIIVCLFFSLDNMLNPYNLQLSLVAFLDDVVPAENHPVNDNLARRYIIWFCTYPGNLMVIHVYDWVDSCP